MSKTVDLHNIYHLLELANVQTIGELEDHGILAKELKPTMCLSHGKLKASPSLVIGLRTSVHGQEYSVNSVCKYVFNGDVNAAATSAIGTMRMQLMKKVLAG